MLWVSYQENLQDSEDTAISQIETNFKKMISELEWVDQYLQHSEKINVDSRNTLAFTSFYIKEDINHRLAFFSKANNSVLQQSTDSKAENINTLTNRMFGK